MKNLGIGGFLALLFLLVSNLAGETAGTQYSNTAPKDCSGTIATGGTAQNAFAANPYINGFQILNLDSTEPLWISFTGTASAGATGSYPLPAATATTFVGAGSFYTVIGFNTALSVVAATTSHKYSCTRW